MARRKLDWNNLSRESVRKYFCNNQRRLHRRFLRYIGIAVVSLLALSNVFHFISWDDRKEMHAEFLEMKRTAEMSQTMLDARARIQITLINTAKRRGAFIDSEKQMICSLWGEAQYDRTGEKCPE